VKNKLYDRIHDLFGKIWKKRNTADNIAIKVTYQMQRSKVK